MKNNSPRQLIWEFLVDTERSQGYINLEIEKLHQNLPEKERSFATELIFGSVRQRLRLDWTLEQYLSREIDSELRELLRLGAYESLFMRTPAHAVVFEYVELAKKVLGSARSTMVNAVLRKIVSNQEMLQDPRGISLEIETSHPDWIVNSFAQIIKGEEELRSELLSHNEAAAVQAVSFIELKADEGQKDARMPFGYCLKKPPHEIKEIRSGSGFIQDFGSQIIAQIMLATDPECKYQWLDLCAGPGGKFTYLAHFLSKNQLAGIELHEHRSKLIRDRNPGYQITTGDAQKIEEVHGKADKDREVLAPYQRILIDAPCTGLGALRRRPDARWRKSEADLKGLVDLQRNLLLSGAALLDSEGIIGYATCSPHILETRVQVAEFLRKNPDFHIHPINPLWIDSDYHSAITSEGYLQLMTSQHNTDGMFLALLERKK